MSLQIELKKSAVSQKQPFPSDLALGEIALNYNADGPFLTCKDTAGNIRKITGVWVGASAPSSPTAGDPWLDTTSTPVLKIYNGSTWVSAVSVSPATTSAYGTVRLATTADVTNGTAGKVVDAAQLASRVTTDIASALAADPFVVPTLSVTGNATVTGNLTVNGTQVVINTQTLDVEDRNIILGNVGSPTDSTANTGGITLKGATDKTFSWLDATDSWTSSENVDLASGKSYRINGTEVLSATALGSAVQISSANIPNGTIVDSDINAAAEIAVSKLADGAARQLLQTDAAGTGVEWTSNVDIPGTLDVTGAARFDSTAAHPLGTAAAPTITFTGANAGIYSPGADQLAVATSGSERLRVDSSGRLLAGTSSARANFGNSSFSARLQIEGTGFSDTTISSVRSNDDAAAAAFIFGKNRGGVGTNVIVQDNDELGQIFFSGNDGSEFVNGAAIRAFVDGAPGANDMPSRLVFSVTAAGASTPTEALRIDSAGRVGIGNASPEELLDVAGTTKSQTFKSLGGFTDLTPLQLDRGSIGSGLHFELTSTDYRVVAKDKPLFLDTDSPTGSISFRVNASEKARVDSDGRLLLGTSTDVGGALLQVNGDRFRIATAKTPALTGTGAAGEVCWDADYIYVCTATNTWKRTAIGSDDFYSENVTAVAALDVDCSLGNYFTKTIAANSTFTFSNAPASGRAYAFTLEVTHTSGTITWPTSVKWPYDVTPTLTTGKTHLFMFVTRDGGTRWRGSALVDYVD